MPPSKPITRAGLFIKAKKASFSELLFDPVAPRQPIIDPWLDRGSAALVWGTTGVGKSYFAQTMALMAATGGRLPYLGWSAGGGKPLKVLWFDGEQGIRTAQTRAREMIRLGDGKYSPIEVPEDISKIIADKGVEDFLDYRSKVIAKGRYPDLGKEEDRTLVEQVIKEGNFDLVIFDNLMVLSTVDSWDDAAKLSDMCSWFNLMAKRLNCAALVMHHARKDGTSFNGSARIGQDFEVIASLQLPNVRTPLAFDQCGPGFSVDFLKMRDQPKGWKGEPVHMVFCTDGWRTWEHSDVGKYIYGLKFTDTELRSEYYKPEYKSQKQLAARFGVSDVTIRARAKKAGLPEWRFRPQEHDGSKDAPSVEIEVAKDPTAF